MNKHLKVRFKDSFPFLNNFWESLYLNYFTVLNILSRLKSRKWHNVIVIEPSFQQTAMSYLKFFVCSTDFQMVSVTLKYI